MISIFLLGMLLVTGALATVVLIWIGYTMYVFFIRFLLEAISLLVLQKSMKLQGGGINFIPVARGVNEGAMITSLRSSEGDKRVVSYVVCFLYRAIYMAFLALLYGLFIYFYGDRGEGRQIPFAVLDVTCDIMESSTFIIVGGILAVAIAVLFILIAIARTKAMKGAGFHPAVAILVAVFLGPIWGIITGLYLGYKERKANQVQY